MGYSAKAAANYFLSKYRKHGITPLKIQKLVYIAHGWHLAYFDKPLVEDEDAEAWEFGPVFPSLYHEFKYRGRMPIIELATILSIKDRKNLSFEKKIPNILKSDNQTIQLLDTIWEVYGNLTGAALSSLTHRENSPWAEVRAESNGKRNTNIDNEIIKKYYKKLKSSGK